MAGPCLKKTEMVNIFFINQAPTGLKLIEKALKRI